MYEDIIDKENLSLWQKLFRKIAILDLGSEKKTAVAEKMVNYSYADVLYWFQLVLSSVIATLGLLINSSPVVIGAMLISPILQPIQSFAFAVNTWHKLMYIRSLNNLMLSIVVSLVVAALVTWTVPFSSLTSQIIARTTPTILDLFIALSWGAIAMLALWYKRLSDTLAGVAMAASLLPPLCVVWIGLAFFRWDIAQWSMLLFLANLVALILIGLLVFYMFWFFPNDKKSQTLSLSRIFMVIVTVILVAIPLRTGMHAIAQDYRLTQIITSVTREYVSDIHSHIILTNAHYEDRQGAIRVNLTLQAPEWVRFTTEDKNLLSRKLFSALQQSVELDVQILYVAGAYVRNAIKPISDKELSIRNHFTAVFSGSYLQNISLHDNQDTVSIAMSFVTSMDKNTVYDYLSAWKNVLTKYRWVPVYFDVEVSYVDIISL